METIPALIVTSGTLRVGGYLDTFKRYILTLAADPSKPMYALLVTIRLVSSKRSSTTGMSADQQNGQRPCGPYHRINVSFMPRHKH